MAVPSTPPPDAQPDAPGKNTPLPSTTNGDMSIQKPSDGPPPQSSTVPVPKTSPDDGLAPPSSSPSGNVLSDPLPRASLSDRQNIVDGDKPDPEDASTSHTLTPNKPTSSSAARKANASSISDAATTAQPNGSHSKNQPSSVHSSKPTFFSKLFRALIPCVTPSKSHDIELDLPSSKPQPPASSSNEKAPHDAKNDPNVAASKGASASSPSQLVSSAEPLDTTGLAPIPISVTPPPTLPADADVVLPPTPTTKLLPESETEGVTSGAVQPPGSTGGSSLHEKPHSRDSTAPSHASLDAEDSEGTSFTEDEDIDDVNGIDDLEDEEEKLILNGGAGIPIGPDGIPKPLLPPISPQHAGRKCLVLDLDETLVHSSFKSIQQADYVVPVEIEYHWHNVYVIKRPGVDNFLKKMGEIYEVVVFTASLSKYADPVLDKLDIHQVVSHRLFRESCYNHKGNYVKDLSQLGRPIADTIILDNSPASYIFHPNNAVPVSSWFNDPHDTELTDLVPFLTDLSTVDDVRGVLDGAR